MGVLAALVPQFQPARWGGGFEGSGTEGATWKWLWSTPTTNPDGSVVNLSGVTGVCKIYDSVGGAVVATLTFAGRSDGTCDLTCDESVTANLANGADPYTFIRQCRWGFTMTDGTDVLQVWSPSNSIFQIFKAA